MKVTFFQIKWCVLCQLLLVYLSPNYIIRKNRRNMGSKTNDFGIKEALIQLGIKEINEGTSTGSSNFSSGDIIESFSPVDGKLIGKVKTTSQADYDKVIEVATNTFKTWRTKPSPQRGEIVR